MIKLLFIFLLFVFNCNDDSVSPSTCNIEGPCDLSENSLMIVNIDGIEDFNGEIWYNFNDVQGVEIIIDELTNPAFQINPDLEQFVLLGESGILNYNDLIIVIAFNDGINSCGLLGVIEEINSSTSIVQIELVNSSGYMIEPYADGCP